MYTVFISALWLIECGFDVKGTAAQCQLTPIQVKGVNDGTYLGALAIIDKNRTEEMAIPFVKATYNGTEIDLPLSQITRAEAIA
ncbi:MAG: hypothetical protein QY314_03535 [Candidatus Dojkabacteria bacterium]|nr:MAG: hypothetical protein QY314_03535 [Candidatus Dojkabacteria bacterium]